MFKKIFFTLILLLSLCGCDRTAKIQTYEEFYTDITNFSDKLVESGYQSILYEATIAGAPSVNFHLYQQTKTTIPLIAIPMVRILITVIQTIILTTITTITTVTTVTIITI